MGYAPALQQTTGSRWNGSARHIGMSHAQKNLEQLGNLTLCQEVYITNAQIKALHTTAVPVVAAPGAGYALIFRGASVFHDYGGTSFTLATDSDLEFHYTDASGTTVGSIAATGFLDTSDDQLRWCRPVTAASGNSDITPVANAALVLACTAGSDGPSVGDGVLKCQVFYSVIKTDLSFITSSQVGG
jgi:hypothetical protein